MDEKLKAKADLFIETYDSMKKLYRWSAGDLTLRFAALVYMLGDMRFQSDVFNDTVNYIKKNSKLFSYYRSHQKYSTAALLITKSPEPQKAFDCLLEYEDKLKKAGFKNSPYLSIAAYALLLTCNPEEAGGRVEKAMKLYRKMKENHFWLTTSDDYPVAVLMSASEAPEESLLSEIEYCYDALRREGFYRGNGLQFLSHLLSFIPDNEKSKVQKAKHIYDRLKNEGLRIASPYYGIIGYLSLLGEYSDQAVGEVLELVSYLKSNRSFRWVNKGMNTLAATALVANNYFDTCGKNGELLETGIGISIEAMIAAQTAALIAAASAAASAGAAASSGS